MRTEKEIKSKIVALKIMKDDPKLSVTIRKKSSEIIELLKWVLEGDDQNG